MWTTPAPPSTAFVASSIWSGVGEVKTSPGHAASSIPRPTNPPCIGSCPGPPPGTIPTRHRLGDERVDRLEAAGAVPLCRQLVRAQDLVDEQHVVDGDRRARLERLALALPERLHLGHHVAA